ncbi:UNVERIFIED_ORG: hypothetical protein BDK47_10469 [Anoxybacillus amylolyticus]|uniref:Uncharacterized protein n=4 Tax=Geobacillus TaxID=129337 RepID=A0A7U9P5B5_GEOTM|nr:hypothetical protein GC56T3_0935 [Geobacillus sp. C56-T3]ADU94971.1 hypothetical protein GYMC52_2591 [Geobacillus sp. Y412MC52]AEV20183.1 hypothetical protein GTCCBUS3UF5_28800 [Geobacillus thermoleovorans CCB_US3_UF5]EPR29107.1 hypothetical protein I656_01235 [Geobacillus sp. WSUCF1]EQB96018.1 hypothetical protein GA8_08365 [Geobacillus sp. A8]ESU70454.1 hypothetical protein T260_18135 [Geobacillus sp. MAS1]KAF0994364.1 hypothetical protein BJQ97_01006 [Geobacillus sp. TFV-3]KJE29193.1 h
MLQSILTRELAHREEFPRLKEIPDEGQQKANPERRQNLTQGCVTAKEVMGVFCP